MTAEQLIEAIKAFQKANPKKSGMFFFQDRDADEDGQTGAVAIHAGDLADALEVLAGGLVGYMRRTLTPESAASVMAELVEALEDGINPVTIVTDAQNN